MRGPADLVRDRRRRRHGRAHAVRRGAPGPGRRARAAAHQPPARLPGLRPRRRVPAAGHDARVRSGRVALRRGEAALGEADPDLRPRPARPRALHPVRALHALRRRDRGRRADQLRRPRRTAPRSSRSRTTRSRSYFSGNTVQICPVGALTATPYRFRARPWDLSAVETSCTTCSVHCRGALESSSNRLVRLLGVDSEPVNHGWLCDKGRFGYEVVHSEERVRQPDGAQGRRARRVLVARGARRRRGRAPRARSTLNGPQSVALLGGARGTNEDAYVWARFAKGVARHGQRRRAARRRAPGRGRARSARGDHRRPRPRRGDRRGRPRPQGRAPGPLPAGQARGRGARRPAHRARAARPGPHPLRRRLDPLGARRAGRRRAPAGRRARRRRRSSDADDGPGRGAARRAATATSSSCSAGATSPSPPAATVQAAAELAQLPRARFLVALRRGNVRGALDLGLAPGLPARAGHARRRPRVVRARVGLGAGEPRASTRRDPRGRRAGPRPRAHAARHRPAGRLPGPHAGRGRAQRRRLHDRDRHVRHRQHEAGRRLPPGHDVGREGRQRHEPRGPGAARRARRSRPTAPPMPDWRIAAELALRLGVGLRPRAARRGPGRDRPRRAGVRRRRRRAAAPRARRRGAADRRARATSSCSARSRSRSPTPAGSRSGPGLGRRRARGREPSRPTSDAIEADADGRRAEPSLHRRRAPTSTARRRRAAAARAAPLDRRRRRTRRCPDATPTLSAS